MTPSLRSRVVEAGARAIEAEAKKWPREDHPLGWGTRTPPPGASMTDLSQAALDAMLSCLTENADEWAKRADGWIDDSVAKDLLAVLRNPQ